MLVHELSVDQYVAIVDEAPSTRCILDSGGMVILELTGGTAPMLIIQSAMDGVYLKVTRKV